MIFFSRTVSSQREFDDKITKVEKKSKDIEVDEQETDTGISSSPSIILYTLDISCLPLKDTLYILYFCVVLLLCLQTVIQSFCKSLFHLRLSQLKEYTPS